MKIKIKVPDEIDGLDLPEMSVLAYPDLLLVTSHGKDGNGLGL